MKHLFIYLTLAISIFITNNTQACVGRILTIGTMNANQEKLLAEMMAVIINERTGTTVTISYFNNKEELYAAVKKGEVSILIENTDRAMEVLSKKVTGSNSEIYKSVKEDYRKNLDLVMLDPLGITPSSTKDGDLFYVPIITTEVLTDYPALPRVINKLSGVSEDKTFGKMLSAIDSGKKPRGVAKDYLKKKKLI
ncbi:MAG: hypothetical protein KKE17_00535 [Proteobacteria bacterium]|nr:hypothetical protein [Pseudomonadota bacterium]MBU1708468.1 hypothetical protein [Pseudomonadota bacterium]